MKVLSRLKMCLKSFCLINVWLKINFQILDESINWFHPDLLILTLQWHQLQTDDIVPILAAHTASLHCFSLTDSSRCLSEEGVDTSLGAGNVGFYEHTCLADHPTCPSCRHVWQTGQGRPRGQEDTCTWEHCQACKPQTWCHWGHCQRMCHVFQSPRYTQLIR